LVSVVLVISCCRENRSSYFMAAFAGRGRRDPVP
jgi:hypothetical protein